MLIPGFVSWSLPPGLHKQLALGGITMLGWEMSSLPTGRSAPAGSRVLNVLQASCSSPDDGALFLFCFSVLCLSRLNFSFKEDFWMNI